MKKCFFLLLCIHLLVSCSEKKECYWCGEEKNKTTIMTFFEGTDNEENVDICRECRSAIISELTYLSSEV